MQEIAELRQVLDGRRPTLTSSQQRAFTRANSCLDRAQEAVDAKPADNEAGWSAFHAARREELRLRSPTDLDLICIDLEREADEKLGSWRKKAVDAYRSGDATKVDRLVRIQQHLDETATNEVRKRTLQHRQLTAYLLLLGSLVVVLVLLELAARGVLLRRDPARTDGWWVVNAALYGAVGGAFSAASRVANRGMSGRYPEHVWQRLANTFTVAAGAAAALIALAALQAGLLGSEGVTGPRVAFMSFIAGFSERFVPSLARGQGR